MFPECAIFDVLKDEVIGSFDRPVDVSTVRYKSELSVLNKSNVSRNW